jgi:imidazolonepropionase-like amidohydrolase
LRATLVPALAVRAGLRSLLACAAVVSSALSAGAARAQQAPTAIVHGQVYLPGDRPPVQDGTVVLADGKVLAAGPGVAVPAGARTIDARGKVVTAGFIDANTDVGLVDVELEPATNDADAHGAYTPALRIVDGYNPRSSVIPVVRAGGVTSVVLAPRWGVLSGQGAFVDLAEETAPPVVRAPLAQYARIDEESAEATNGTRAGMWLALREALDDARFYGAHKGQYDSNASRVLSLRRAGLEALQPVIRGELPLVVTAHRASDIETALRLGDELKLRMVIQGGSEAWMVAPELARRKVAVVLDPLEDLPARFDRLHARSDNAARLARSGVKVVIATFATHQSRLLWQHAGNAVRLGMDHDAAVRAVTEAPADVFDLKGYGRLEPGAVGNVVVWSGDPFQTSTRVEHVFVRGREQPLETRQTLLLQRYRTLPVPRDGSR